MAWRTIVITQHCKISCKLNSLIITNEKETFLIPLHDIETVLIQTTRATITTYAIAQLLERNIKI
ncbi:MAG: CRISPR-associated endonuclease Cas1, partial [Bifidobacteriaceae bacterium]|nr:CRISPR-associated endonuclease Cas1 [Bifidobacteriaceae bacterium]